MSRTSFTRNGITLLVCTVFAASFAGAQTTWHVDDDAPNDPGPDDPAVSDPLEDGSEEHPFDAIQEGIDAATDGDTVLVHRGSYFGEGNQRLDFDGKAITVRSQSGPRWCIIRCDEDGWAVHFQDGETADTVLDGLRITDACADEESLAAVACSGASPTIVNCVIEGNHCTGLFCSNSSAVIRNCTIAENTDYSASAAGVVLAGGTDTLEDCTIARNVGMNCGGVALVGGYVTLLRCAITGNVAIPFDAGAGGLDAACAYVTIADCEITGNVGGSCGGGILAFGSSVAITDCRVVGNTSTNSGGGISVIGGSAIVRRSEMSYNYSAEGGGIAGWGNTLLQVVDCTIMDNIAQSRGGGVHAESGTMLVDRCTIVSNRSHDSGGGLSHYDSELTLGNSAIARNFADDRGGGVYLHGGTAAITNCTITENASGDSEAGAAMITWSDSSLTNSIVWGNSAPDGYQLSVHRGPTTIAFSVIEGGQDAVKGQHPHSLIWGPGNIDADPLFVDPDNADYRLLTGSPGLDAGCNCAVLADVVDADADGDTDEYVPFDLDGESRFFDDPNTPDGDGGIPPVVDIGAYEFGGSDLPPCRGDLDGDRDIDLADLTILIGNYGMTSGASGTDGDMDCDGDVDLADLGALLSRYGASCS